MVKKNSISFLGYIERRKEGLQSLNGCLKLDCETVDRTESLNGKRPERGQINLTEKVNKMSLTSKLSVKPTVVTSAPAPTTATVDSNKKKSQYWCYDGIIMNLEKLSNHAEGGVAFLFESGYPIDDTEKRIEAIPKNEDSANRIRALNDMRAERYTVMCEGLDAGDFKVLYYGRDEPQVGDYVKVIRRLSEKSHAEEAKEQLAKYKRTCRSF